MPLKRFCVFVVLSIASLSVAQQTAYGQCGGIGWTGATSCASGNCCTYSNPYYSQCLPGNCQANTATTTVKPATTTSASSATTTSAGSTTTSTFTYNSQTFLVNGQPFQIIGGQMDPQRVPRAYWASRLQMAKSMGLNTIFSYIYWHYLEPAPGQWNFTGSNDIAAWYDAVQAAGLKAVLRPGPYVCGERDWGGFPAWLSQISGMTVRANNQPFLNAASSYIEEIGAQLKSKLVRNGGPILMVQVENEYGNYGSDHTYTAALYNLLKANFDSVFYTNDAGNQGALQGGQIPGVLAEIDGDPRSGFTARNQYVTNSSSLGPLLDGEFYVDWFDYWGPHSSYQTFNSNGTASFLSDIDWILSNGNSFSLYMFHGGTNFGFGNGAVNFGTGYEPFTTSYDYGAPLDETGRVTSMYTSLRNTIANHVPSNSIPAIPSIPSMSTVSDFTLTPVLGLFDSLSNPVSSTSPQSMEQLGQSFGYILYEYKATASFSGKVQPGDIPRDRVIVYVNGVKQGVIDAIYKTPATVSVSIKSGDVLRLFVENLGRNDYGNGILDQRKGIVGNVSIGGQSITGFNIYKFPLDTLPSNIATASGHSITSSTGMPVFYTGSFTTNNTGQAADTFLQLPGGIKGVVWVNGFNLGRFWTVGPQQELYLPGSVLNSGAANSVVVLELEPGTASRVARGVATRSWKNNADPDCNSCT